MKKKLIMSLAALLIAVGFVAIAAPAQALGWSGARCDWQAGNGAKVCVEVHTVAYPGGGIRVDQVEVCAYHYSDPGNHFRGVKDGDILFNQGGVWTGTTNAGACTYTTYSSPKNGISACYHFYGTLNIALYDDKSTEIIGALLGGPC